MNVFALHTLRCWGGILLLVLVAAGCRTYGVYGNEEETLGQIREANRLFAEELGRTQADLSILERAAASNPALGDFAARYATVAEQQAEMVEAHQALAEKAAEHPGNYRILHRTYGAIVSDQQRIRDRYTDVLMDIARAVGASLPDQAVPPASRYQVAPPFYERIAYDVARRPLVDLLRGSQAGGATPVQQQP